MIETFSKRSSRWALYFCVICCTTIFMYLGQERQVDPRQLTEYAFVFAGVLLIAIPTFFIPLFRRIDKAIEEMMRDKQETGLKA